MAAKSEYLQIRVSPAQKAKLKRLARAAGQDLSGYVLERALPEAALRFEALLRMLRDQAEHRTVLAELNDFLSALTPTELEEAVSLAEVEELSPLLANYVAAMVELASHSAGVPSPLWTRRIPPLERPHFAAPMRGLRPHLLRASPIPFKRRNIFVDASLGARV